MVTVADKLADVALFDDLVHVRDVLMHSLAVKERHCHALSGLAHRCRPDGRCRDCMRVDTQATPKKYI
jgi:hypothetical protein